MSKHTKEERRRYYEYLVGDSKAFKQSRLTEADYDAIAGSTAGIAIRMGIAMEPLKRDVNRKLASIVKLLASVMARGRS